MAAGRGIVSRAARGRALALALPVLLGATPAAADQPAPLAAAAGPIEVREEWLPAQNRLTLPAASPDVLARGRVQLRFSLDWGNDFGWMQDVRGERPRDRRFLVDGEHRTLALELRRGLGGGLEAGARLPLRWRGPGFLDGLINAFHELGLPDNQRPFFQRDRFRLQGRDRAGRLVTWQAEQGTGLGNLELQARWSTARGERDPRLGLVGRLGLPTGTGPFEADGLEAGLQTVAAAPLSDSLELYAGIGGTAFGDLSVAGLEYPRLRGMGFLVLEWRAARALRLSMELNGASRLLTNLADYPGFQSYFRLGARFDLPGRMDLEAGFTENLVDQQATTDFGAFFGLTRSF